MCHFIVVPLYMYAAILYMHAETTCMPLCILLWIFTLQIDGTLLVLRLYYLNNVFIYKQNTIIAY